MSKYTDEQIFNKVQEAQRFLFDAESAPNDEVKKNDLHGASQCLASAYNMLAENNNEKQNSKIY